MQTTEQSLDHRGTARRLLAAAWVVAPAWVFFQAFGLLFTLFGQGPTAGEQAEAARWLVLSGALAVGLAGAAVALGGGSRWSVALGFSLGYCLLLVPVVADLRPDAPPAASPPPSCVVHSGSDDPCPGG